MANPTVQKINEELESLQKELVQFKSTIEYLSGAKSNVNTALKALDQAENNFESKVKELKITYDSVIKLSDIVNLMIKKIDTVNFPERLDNIEKTVKETIESLNKTRKSTIEELQKASEIITKADFDGRFKKLKGSIDSAVDTNKNLTIAIEEQNLPSKIDGFERSISKKLESSISEIQSIRRHIVAETTKTIVDLNLPMRIDILDASISGITSAIQYMQSRIEGLEKSLNLKLENVSKEQSVTLMAFQEVLKQNFAELKSELNSNAQKQQNNAYITYALILSGILILSLLIIL